MPLPRHHLDHIILDATYQSWIGPNDPRFIADEVEYKRAAIEKASNRLGEGAVRDLVHFLDLFYGEGPFTHSPRSRECPPPYR